MGPGHSHLLPVLGQTQLLSVHESIHQYLASCLEVPCNSSAHFTGFLMPNPAHLTPNDRSSRIAASMLSTRRRFGRKNLRIALSTGSNSVAILPGTVRATYCHSCCRLIASPA
eukprot:scaffold34431_cov24-Cyclotella_meneghiniana.AAC.1